MKEDDIISMEDHKRRQLQTIIGKGLHKILQKEGNVATSTVELKTRPDKNRSRSRRGTAMNDYSQ